MNIQDEETIEYEEIIPTQKNQQKDRLFKANQNYESICDMDLSDKFGYVDEWIYKKSNILLKEAEIYKDLKNEKKFVSKRTYKRGSIVKIDFGVNIGSELSQMHFGVVLTKYDKNNIDTLIVLPLSSSDTNFNKELNYDIFANLLDKEQLFLKVQKTNLNYIKRQMADKSIKEQKGKRELSIIYKNIKFIENVICYYKNHNKKTYYCIDQVRSISKSRIIEPINSYDILEQTKLPNPVMNQIDIDIAKKYANVKMHDNDNIITLAGRKYLDINYIEKYIDEMNKSVDNI